MIIGFYSVILPIHIFRMTGLCGCKAVSGSAIPVQAIFIYFKITVLSMCLDDMGFLIKAYFVLSYQFLRGIRAVIPVIRASCLVVDIRFTGIGVLAYIRDKGQGDFLGIILIKMPVCQLFIHILRCLFRYDIGAIGEHDGMVVVIILSILCIALQRGPVTIRTSARILIPGNCQAAVQTCKDIQISGSLPLCPQKRFFIGCITV